MLKFLRGQVLLANLGVNQVGSEQQGTKPVVIVQNDVGNFYSPTVIVAVITSKGTKAKLPTHVDVSPSGCNGLDVSSTILLEQIRVIDKQRLTKFLGNLSSMDMDKVDTAMIISLGLTQKLHKEAVQ